jgi:molybdenum cofactor synthesis domain-containing protein
MVSVEVLSVGRELLIGKTANTNAHWIGGRLARMGSMISRMTTVTDSLKEISSALNEILSRRPDFVVVLGGLGPTPDDMTLEGVALAIGAKLRVNPEAIQMIKEHYRALWKGEIEITPSRRKMAKLPEGASPLPNAAGTAPGVRLKKDGTVIFCLPGVPREMKEIFRSSIEKEMIKEIGTLHTATVILNLEKIFESTLAPILQKMIRLYPGVYVKSHPKGVKEGVSRLELDIVVSSEQKRQARSLADEIASYATREIKKNGGVIASRKDV